MTIMADHRWIGPHGIGRFAAEILQRLEGDVQVLPLTTDHVSPLDPFRVTAVLRKFQPDVYFTPGYIPPWHSPVPLVFCLHDLMHLDIPAESSVGKRLFYRYIIRPAAQTAAAILTVSEYSRQRIIDWAGIEPDRVHVIYPAASDVFSDVFTQHGESEEPGFQYFLYVGGYKPHKNVPALITAFSHIASSHDANIHLQLTGNPPPSILHLPEELHISDNIHFTGVVDEQRLASLYRGAIALVMPSSCEGFGLPALEAMACGTPVITTNAASIPEVVGDAALFVDPQEPESIVEAMQRILNDDQQCNLLRQRGVERASRFSWDTAAKNVQNILNQAQQQQ